MELFHKANAIRLKSTHHDKYLVAEKDEESVSQDRKGKSSKIATWNVELVQGGNFIRLKSCYGKYLTALDAPFHLGMHGKKVVQTFPTGLMDSSSIEWEPIRSDGHQFKLKSRRSGDYLRANGGLPPGRNSITHDIPHRTSTQDCILWEVDMLDMQVQPIVVSNDYAKDEKEAKPKENKHAKLAKLLVAKPPKEKKEAKSKEEKTEEEEQEGEGEGEREGEGESESESESESEGGEEQGEEEGSPNSRFGFRKFLHKLKGGGSDGEGEGEGEGDEEGEGEGEGEGGSPRSRFGFRKFLHNLNGGDGEEGEGEGEGEGGGEVEFNFEFEF